MPQKEGSELWVLGSKFLKYMGRATALATAVMTILTASGWVVKKVYQKEINDFYEVVEFGEKAKDSILPRSFQEHVQIYEAITEIKDYIEKKSRTHAVGLRVGEDGDLWYKATDLRLYRAHYREEWGAYYYTDRTGHLIECQ